LGIFIDKNGQFGNFCIDKMVHFGKILYALILLNQKILVTVHAIDLKLLQDTRSCNGAMIAGPDQSLPARIKFGSKLVHYGVSPVSQEKQLVCLFQNIAGLLKKYFTFKNSENTAEKKSIKYCFCYKLT